MRAGMKLKLFTSVPGLILLSIVTIKQTSDFQKTEWLIGTWENKTARGSIYERWISAEGNLLSGKSYVIGGQDTIVLETIQLVQERGKLFYIPTVKGQNDGFPVHFASKIVTETQLIFENPEHDFPQIISYRKITADSLVAEISGTKNGQEHKQTFPMKRVE